MDEFDPSDPSHRPLTGCRKRWAGDQAAADPSVLDSFEHLTDVALSLDCDDVSDPCNVDTAFLRWYR